MVSSDSHLVASTDNFSPHGFGQLHGIGERLFGGLREALCGLHGHDSLLQFEGDRMFLKCFSCGHESPGWKVDKNDATAPAHVERRPAGLPHFIGARRTA